MPAPNPLPGEHALPSFNTEFAGSRERTFGPATLPLFARRAIYGASLTRGEARQRLDDLSIKIAQTYEVGGAVS